ncbi:Rhamnose utilization protein RhaD, predicted bifunctional aldolase and dehydrogenase [Candidatus Electrothrix marina]|uniref:Rhamnose utilization protein RhaD, predicted bifunctional aldolase and dehydrogenase n=1 Tax=Candidatus Electrothrix marina TaxID=1859130 RepID=A0A3S3R3J3_9BACT|nr:Rhamnose utilization protein RhaD, predicted bifunctional aldolase and dehydrogenase [Candidatus Electrothrix marina]RWX51989.1 Rhamnose utilization protein RhaD, predicted bifunctional aldolase and dehydrogenase [Candidatus Electrothrix marina]
MLSLWSEQEAGACENELELRVYSSRLLGRDSSLVLHGGGNTSVKITEKNVVGEEEEILYIKGSGWDLETIEAEGFAPVRLQPMIQLAALDTLTDPQMVNELKTQLTRSDAPAPSVETILHAALPFRYVDHTHADAVVTVTNTADGLRRIEEIYGDLVVVIPYVMPGFDLARDVARLFAEQAGPQAIGMVLMNHGVFSFADSAKESYERMIQLVDMAESYLAAHNAWELELPAGNEINRVGRLEIAQLRQDVSEKAGRPMILHVTDSVRGRDFVQRDDVGSISQQGPITPDHVIRTKAVPMLGRNVESYAQAYKQYFATHEPAAKERKTILDPAPRVILDQDFGLCCLGKSAKDAAIVHDIYEHAIECILRGEKLGGWQALPPEDLFDMEYWDLEQAKLAKAGTAPLFSGEVVLITGAASGIGKACIASFLQRGAAVVGLDIDERIAAVSSEIGFLGIQCDLTEEGQVLDALDQAVSRFGGLDMLVLNAGMFPAGTMIAEQSLETWRKVMAVNLDANLVLLRECYPLLKHAPGKGRVVVIGSKNVPAPGPGAGAYSASKAALTQLMRVAALEWGKDGIRINALHPNAVFDTGIWTDEVLEARAKHYGLSVQQYKTNNLLGVEVLSRQVAELASEMCGSLFASTTAAQLPVDGGNDRVV